MLLHVFSFVVVVVVVVTVLLFQILELAVAVFFSTWRVMLAKWRVEGCLGELASLLLMKDLLTATWIRLPLVWFSWCIPESLVKPEHQPSVRPLAFTEAQWWLLLCARNRTIAKENIRSLLSEDISSLNTEI